MFDGMIGILYWENLISLERRAYNTRNNITLHMVNVNTPPYRIYVCRRLQCSIFNIGTASKHSMAIKNAYAKKCTCYVLNTVYILF